MRKISLLLSTLLLFFISNNNFAQWVQSNTGLTVNDVNSYAFIGADIFAGTGNVGGNGQGVFKSTDGGSSWAPSNNGLTSLDIRNIISNGTNLFAAVQADTFPFNGGIFLSTDNGANWNAVNTGFPVASAYYIAGLGSTLYASTAGGGGNVYTSTNNGTNWAIATDPILVDMQVKTIIQSGPNTIACSDLGGTNGVFISTDGGTTWAATSLTGETDDLQIIGNMVYAAKGTGVYKSSDNGVTWNPTTNTSGIIDNATALAAIDTMLIVGCPYSVYSSCDKGITWTDISVGAGGANLSTEAFGQDVNNIFIGNTFHSVGIWKRPVSELSCSGSFAMETEHQLQFNVFPNPSSGIFKIESEESEMNVEVYNLLGEKILQKQNSTQIDLTGTVNGVYLLQVTTKNGTAVQKIIKE